MDLVSGSSMSKQGEKRKHCGAEGQSSTSDGAERKGPDSRFPPGFHFAPHDHELIHHYLKRKLDKLPLPYDVFHDVNLYDYSPANLVEKYKEWGHNKWYFFTPRDRKYPKGTRANRTTLDEYGYWKATGAEKSIKNSAGVKIGVRKALVFYTGKPEKGEKTEWIMYEYLKQDPSDPPRKPDGTMQLDEWVLCTIQKKPGADKVLRDVQQKRRADRSQATTAKSNKRLIIPQVRQIPQGSPIDQNFQQSILNPCTESNYHGYQLDRPLRSEVIPQQHCSLPMVMPEIEYQHQDNTFPGQEITGGVDDMLHFEDENLVQDNTMYQPSNDSHGNFGNNPDSGF